MAFSKKYNRSGNSHAGSSIRVITRGYFGEEKLTASERIVANALYTFAQKGGRADFTFGELRFRYNLSYATVARSMKKLRSLCFERAEEPHSYKLKDLLPAPERYFYIPDWYRYASFPKANGSTLTNDQIEILGYITHQNANIPHWRSTQATIARTLGIAPSTVSEAVSLFESLDLLTVQCPDGHTRSVNHLDRAAFTTNDTLLETVRKETIQHPKAPKRRDRAADERADREHFYDQRNKLANEHPNRVRRELGPEYKKLEREFGLLGMQLAKAEHARKMQEWQELMKRRTAITSAMKNFLTEHGFTEDDLKPRHLCPICNDTGYKADGTLCSCYPPGGTT